MAQSLEATGFVLSTQHFVITTQTLVIMDLAKFQQERRTPSDTKNQQLAQLKTELQNFNKNAASPNLHKIISPFKAFVNLGCNTSVIPFLSDNEKTGAGKNSRS